MPSVFTLESPTGFGAPVINQDYLDVLGDPGFGYDDGVGHTDGISAAMLGDATSFFADRGFVIGSVMAFGTSLVVGVILGGALAHGVKKLGWNPE